MRCTRMTRTLPKEKTQHMFEELGLSLEDIAGLITGLEFHQRQPLRADPEPSPWFG